MTKESPAPEARIRISCFRLTACYAPTGVLTEGEKKTWAKAGRTKKFRWIFPVRSRYNGIQIARRRLFAMLQAITAALIF